jgi:hypothetical protein
MAPKYRIRYVDPHFNERFAKLPQEMQKRALQLLGEVANTAPLKGRPCGYQHGTGNLSDCRKLYFDDTDDRDPRYRLVYRVLPSEQAPAEIEVITVGLKYTTTADGERETVYERVGQLLNRI